MNDKKTEEKNIEKENSFRMKKSKSSKIISTVWEIFSKLLTVVIIFICIIIVVQKVTNNKNAFLGYRIFIVQTGSMIPKYQIGDVILVKEVDSDKIKVNDDVTYKGLEEEDVEKKLKEKSDEKEESKKFTNCMYYCIID